MAQSNERTRTRLSPERRKEQLLTCGLDVFAKRGIGRAGHADIADMANVSVATVFNYFPTREDLVEEILAQTEKHFIALINDCTRDSQSMRASLNCITSQIIDTALEDKAWMKVWFEWSTSIREDIWPRFVKGSRDAVEQFVHVFERGMAQGELTHRHQPRELASMLAGICYVLFLQAHQQPDKAALSEMAQKYIDVLCQQGA
ncbi:MULTISPECIES: TetR/AcrR family transcriptional regulator [Salinivibrio]|uniref:TetR/AcrR family transcriptional regulator n=1 Tax=Salinivibrio costicola TaxID=51367 RepID=A0ABX6K193_SALCS|nr:MULTISPECIES: TetR/AcrR family transcriptional regulator [Salinivibrio]ODQ01809.1 LuxR family transcriptional regulator [Salinivibrio sp. DV]OOF16478.1 LuxR family transcriptional regulator [Salinivibrio sp. PR919]OOF18575.1 LuxR family transcriptional regulator [Salinivibrio sp. PR932]OOF24336.1 LuxR family transcriptional regulator [Salinivibrio sp. IB574]PCE68880.1 TetR/AcrR family transcriptional regulator [Salinivibrio sp. YCSC6]